MDPPRSTGPPADARKTSQQGTKMSPKQSGNAHKKRHEREKQNWTGTPSERTHMWFCDDKRWIGSHSTLLRRELDHGLRELHHELGNSLTSPSKYGHLSVDGLHIMTSTVIASPERLIVQSEGSREREMERKGSHLWGKRRCGSRGGDPCHK